VELDSIMHCPDLLVSEILYDWGGKLVFKPTNRLNRAANQQRH